MAKETVQVRCLECLVFWNVPVGHPILSSLKGGIGICNHCVLELGDQLNERVAEHQGDLKELERLSMPKSN